MASETKRGCGYRKVGALYLESDPDEFWTVCDRLPYELTTCPTCGHGLKHSRTPQPINPLALFGIHEFPECRERMRDMMCSPSDELAFVMWIGSQHYSPQEYITESITMGVSRRLRTIPKGLEIGKTICYFAHIHAIHLRQSDDPKVKFLPAIFCVTRPRRIVQLVWESELTDAKKKELEKRGITPVSIPDGDADHAPSKKARELVTV